MPKLFGHDPLCGRPLPVQEREDGAQSFLQANGEGQTGVLECQPMDAGERFPVGWLQYQVDLAGEAGGPGGSHVTSSLGQLLQGGAHGSLDAVGLAAHPETRSRACATCSMRFQLR